MKKMVGLILVILGVGSIWWGYDLSQSMSGMLTDAVGGENNQVMIRYAAGAVMLVAGAFLVLRKA